MLGEYGEQGEQHAPRSGPVHSILQLRSVQLVVLGLGGSQLRVVSLNVGLAQVVL